LVHRNTSGCKRLILKLQSLVIFILMLCENSWEIWVLRFLPCSDVSEWVIQISRLGPKKHTILKLIMIIFYRSLSYYFMIHWICHNIANHLRVFLIIRLGEVELRIGYGVIQLVLIIVKHAYLWFIESNRVIILWHNFKLVFVYFYIIIWFLILLYVLFSCVLLPLLFGC
jgi:hypothetical protein